MIPPKTLNFLRSSQTLKRFRDCPRLAILPYATYGSAHQVRLAAEILGAALYWRSERFRVLKRSSTVKSTTTSTVKSTAPAKAIVSGAEVNLPHPPAPVHPLVETPGEE